jgi:hypothetical protein
MRARKPRPYLDKYKKTPNAPWTMTVKVDNGGKTGGFPARYNLFVENDKFCIPGQPASFLSSRFPASQLPSFRRRRLFVRRTPPHHSIIPSFHYSIIPLFHHSIIPLFHHSIIPVVSAANLSSSLHHRQLPQGIIEEACVIFGLIRLVTFSPGIFFSG